MTRCHDDVYRWLRFQGIKFFPVVHWVERGIHTTGNSVPRFHIVWGTGEGLVLGLLAKLEAHPAASWAISDGSAAIGPRSSDGHPGEEASCMARLASVAVRSE